MNITFRSELSEACKILEDYALMDDSLWLFDLDSCVDEEKVARIFHSVPFHFNEDEAHSLSERQLKIHYIKKEYEIIQQLIKIDQYSLLSDRELFFVADSEFSIWKNTCIHSNSEAMDITPIENELFRRYENKQLNSFGLYVLGKIWKQKNDNRSIDVFLASISQFPYCWSCWLELSSSITDSTLFSSICSQLDNQSILKYFFQFHTTSSIMQSSMTTSLYQVLSLLFPSSFYLAYEYAFYYYHLTNYSQALSILQSINLSSCHSKQYQFNYILLLCNTFYALQDSSSILQLIQSIQQDVTLSLILHILSGSYWSLLKLPTKAIIEFTKVVSLDSSCYEGWLLLGTEYLTMNEYKKAISCFQHTIRINSLDYRGYYNLGIVYSLDVNDSLAYYYFMRAISLQKGLPVCWLALGNFFKKQKQMKRAIDAYQHGYEYDKELYSKEGRMCLLLYCCLASMIDESLYIQCLESILKNNDNILLSMNEGIECSMKVLEICKNQNDLDRGLYFCEQLEQRITDPVILEQIHVYDEQFKEQKENLDDSVSMDCSD